TLLAYQHTPVAQQGEQLTRWSSQKIDDGAFLQQHPFRMSTGKAQQPPSPTNCGLQLHSTQYLGLLPPHHIRRVEAVATGQSRNDPNGALAQSGASRRDVLGLR